MIKLIGFDLDNTLWPVKPAILKAEAALTEYFKTLRPELNYPPVNIAALRAKVLEQHPDFSFRLTDLRRRILFEIAAQSPEHRVNANQIADAGMRVFLETRSQVTLYPGAEEALKHLAKPKTDFVEPHELPPAGDRKLLEPFVQTANILHLFERLLELLPQLHSPAFPNL